MLFISLTLTLTMTSYSQVKDEISGLVKERIESIEWRLEFSSSHLIKSSNQAIGAVVVAAITGVLSTILMTSESTLMINTSHLGYATIISGGGSALGLGISSFVNKRKAYKGLKL